jgi:flavodoxin
MKKRLLIIILLALVLVGCGKKEEVKKETSKEEPVIKENSNSAVLYFSVTNNTKVIARMISEETNSDLIEIVPKEKYTDEDINYNNDNSRANKEQNDDKARPEIENKLDLEKYSTIYLGYPIWWGTVPRIIYTLLDNYDLTNKNIVLFCTSGSSGIEQSVKDLKNYNDKLNIITSKRFAANTPKTEITNWLYENNLQKGEPSVEHTKSIKVTINNKEYTLNLEDNATSRKLVELLPLETKMQELNGNEKYVYLSESFPTDSYKPERINKGDVMLFDNSCIVIFYKSFDNKGYNYTKIGHIDNLDDLGSGDVQVKFSK